MQADVVLDDDVVEVRRHPQQHLADDVHQREMLGVDGRRAARAGGEEQPGVVLADEELDREAAWRWDEGGARQIAGRLDLSLALSGYGRPGEVGPDALAAD